MIGIRTAIAGSLGGGKSWESYWVTRGKIFQSDFDDISSWVNDGTFSKVADDALISFDPLPMFFANARQPLILKEGNDLYLFYDTIDDASLLEDKWFTKWAKSTDGGRYWNTNGELIPGRIDGHGYPLVLSAIGWIMKEGNNYYFFRITAKNTAINGSYGEFPDFPYEGDIWTATALDGTWTWVADIPNYPGTYANQLLMGSIFKSGVTYYSFIMGYSDAVVASNGMLTSSSLVGPFTLGTQILTSAMFEAPVQPENPKMFYHPTLLKYICLSNMYYSGSGIMQNTIQISSSISDWAAASLRRLQGSDVMETTNIIGTACPIITPDGGVVIGENGFIPLTYDNTGLYYSPSYHANRRTSIVLMEPSRNVLRFDGSVLGRIYKVQTNSDFIAEFGVQFPANNIGETLGFIYRADGTNANEYILKVQNGGAKLVLIKRVASSESTVATGTASQVVTFGMINRIKIVVSGTSHKAYINGQLQIDTVDNSLVINTHIGFIGENVVNGDIRLLSMRLSDIFTITELPEGTEVNIMADGGICAKYEYARSDGTATFTLNHWPMESFRVNGITYKASNGIWGGDILSLAHLNLPITNYDPDALYYIARMVIQPNLATKNLINDFFKGVKADGVYDEMDALTLYFLHTEQASLLDIKSDTFNHTTVNAPIWIAKTGYEIIETSYIRSHFIPKTNGVKFALNNAGIYNNMTPTALDCLDGCADFSIAYLKIAYGTTYYQYNTLNSSTNVAILWENGFNAFIRTSSSNVIKRLNGVETNIAENSTDRPSKEFYIGMHNNNGTPTYNCIGNKYKYYGFGSAMDLTKRTALETRIQTLYNGIQTAW